MDRESLHWQSKLILLLVLPVVGCGVFFDTVEHRAAPGTVFWVLSLSAGLGILTLALRAATPFAALTGAVITGQLIYATDNNNPFKPWQTFLVPVLTVALLAHIATRIGRAKKEKLGTAEARRGRSAAQVAANLGAAALFATYMEHSWRVSASWPHYQIGVLLIASLAAMAEAAADTVSSEIGQVFGGRPRMITTFRATAPGTDGGISFVGSLAGVAAAALVIGFTLISIAIESPMIAMTVLSVTLAGATAGFLFDSLLGATLELRGWLNNDAVNFLSTICAGMVAAWLAERFVHFPSM